MAKTLVFLRGPKTERRNALAESLRLDVPRAVWIAMDQIDPDPKRAHAGCIGRTKTAIQDPQIDYLFIDNESLMPIHWQAYYALTERNNINALVLGIDIYDPADQAKLNLQLEKLPLFIATVDKYWCVKTDIDAVEVNTWFKEIRKG